MSGCKNELFKICEVNLFGVNKVPLFNKEHIYYYQNVFVRGEVSENFPFIIVYKGYLREKAIKENDIFMNHFYNLVKPRNMVGYDEASISGDSVSYIFHGAKAKALTFGGSIIAIGSYEEDFWIPVSNFYHEIGNIEEFKKFYLKKKIVETLKELEKCMNEVDLIYSELNNEKIQKSIKKLSDLLEDDEFNWYLENLIDDTDFHYINSVEE